MPVLAQESHRSEQRTNTLVAHCTKMRQVPPGGTGTKAAEESTPMVKKGRDGFTEEGTCEEGVDGSVGVVQLEGEV